jgi:hypothetical protein
MIIICRDVSQHSSRRTLMSSSCDTVGQSFLELLFDTAPSQQAQCSCSTTISLPGLPLEVPQPACITQNLINQALGGGDYPLPIDASGNEVYSEDTYFCAAAPGCGIPFYTPASGFQGVSGSGYSGPDKSQVCTGRLFTAPCFPVLNVTTCQPSATPHIYPTECGMEDFFSLSTSFAVKTQVCRLQASQSDHRDEPLTTSSPQDYIVDAPFHRLA